jgi:hypothetical protein
MSTRKPFSPVDANAARSQKPRKKTKSSSNDASASSSLRSGSTVSSLADDTEYDFLTNPKEDIGVTATATVADAAAWNNSSTTPKISNVSEPTRAAGNPKLQVTQASVGNETKSRSKKKTATTSTATKSRSFHPANNNNDSQPPAETRPRRRRRRSKNISKIQSDDHSVASNATGASLETIFEDAAEGEEEDSPASNKASHLLQSSKEIHGAPKETQHATASSGVNGDTANPECKSDPIPQASKCLETISQQENEYTQPKDGRTTKHNGDEGANSDMDETSDDELLGLSLSPPPVEQAVNREAIRSEGKHETETKNDHPAQRQTPSPSTCAVEDSVPRTNDTPKPVQYRDYHRSAQEYQATSSSTEKEDSVALNHGASIASVHAATVEDRKTERTRRHSKPSSVSTSTYVYQAHNIQGRAAFKGSKHATSGVHPTEQGQHSKSSTLSVTGSHRSPILHAPVIQPTTTETAFQRKLPPKRASHQTPSLQPKTVPVDVLHRAETFERSCSTHANKYSTPKLEDTTSPAKLQATEVKSVQFAVGDPIETERELNSHYRVLAGTPSSYRTPGWNDDLETQAYAAEPTFDKTAHDDAMMVCGPYTPIDKHVWQAMMSKPEARLDKDDLSPIGLVVETPAPMQCDSEDSIDGSVLTQDDVFLVDQTLARTKIDHNAAGTIQAQLSRNDLFKEVRHNGPSDGTDHIGEVEMRKGDNVEIHRIGRGLQSPKDRRPGSDHSGGRGMNGLKAAPATTDSIHGGHLQTSHQASETASFPSGVEKLKSALDKSENVYKKMRRRGSRKKQSEKKATTDSLINKHTTETPQPQSDRVSNVTAKPRGKVLQVNGTFETPRGLGGTNSSSTDTVETQRGTRKNENNEVARRVQELRASSFSSVLDSLSTITKENSFVQQSRCKNDAPELGRVDQAASNEKIVARGGSGTSGSEQRLLHLLEDAIHSDIVSTKIKTAPLGAKPDMWTAEHAGSKYKAFGVNAAPVFRLTNGTYYQHPPLPPGWTLAVSRSKNVPFYIHPDFGVTFYSPVPLPSADGTIAGTTLLFQADTPASAQIMKAFSCPSEVYTTPALFGLSSSERSFYNAIYESSDVLPPVAERMKGNTPLGALAVATNAAFSGSEYGMLSSKDQLRQTPDNAHTMAAGIVIHRGDSQMLSNQTSEAHNEPGDPFPGDYFPYNKHSPVDSTEFVVSVAHRRCKSTGIPLDIEIGTKPVTATEDDKFKMDLDATKETQFGRHSVDLRDDASTAQTAAGSTGKESNDTAPLVASTKPTPSSANNSSGSSLNWANGISPGASTSGASPDQRGKEPDSALRTAATSEESTPHAPAIKSMNRDSDRTIAEEMTCYQRRHDTPRYSVASSGELKTPDVAEHADDEKAAPPSDSDFPQADDFDASEPGSYDGSPHSTNEDGHSPSLPKKVIFGPDSDDDNMSYLQSTPIHHMQSVDQKAKISTRFKPTAVPRATPRDGIVSVMVDDHGFLGGADDESYGSVASRSYASGLSGLSRVSHRSLHPLMPLCSLQNPDTFKVSKKSSKKRKTMTKNKPKKKSRSSLSVQVST